MQPQNPVSPDTYAGSLEAFAGLMNDLSRCTQNTLCSQGPSPCKLSVQSSLQPCAGSLEAFAGLMNDSAATLAQRLGRAAEGAQTIDIWRFLGDMTMEVVGTAAFG